ncbi:AAA family ATPase [Clostridium hydrogenum]|uniref:AAA family ATPase n=1 Tax=Clostridium hydrogenum TaxID=2855764 RepID=UPI001F220F11
MKKYFNTTGVCVPRKHYMVNIDNKLKEIKKLIDKENYFVINRPRQYGKTTTLNQLKKHLYTEFLIISISFEGIGDLVFSEENLFCNAVLDIMVDNLALTNANKSNLLKKLSINIYNLKDLSKVITKFIEQCDKEVILLIDEVDKSSNNQLFLSFLGMLRNKYLLRETDEDHTFKSVILAGVHDIKTLKLKLRTGEDKKYNSPWNIAVNFNVDLSFNPEEIATMLVDYDNFNNLSMDIKKLSEKIYYFTSGYPFLVSRICQVIDEDFYEENKQPWTLNDIDKAVKIILDERNTLFDSLIKNLENNDALLKFINRIVLDGEEFSFVASDNLINLGVTYGFLKNNNGKCVVANRIFEQYIYNHLASRTARESVSFSGYNIKQSFITKAGGLNFENILRKFQLFMKEQYSSKDIPFLEQHGRLLFIAFIKPIINGVGFDFKEVQVSEEKRLDLIITYNNFKYIIELKIWRGEKYHENGINQLCNYLDIHNLNKGYLVVFNFNKNKEYKEELICKNQKEIFSVFV